MRFEVPQFIDVEDKIFGPFTWRQFIYLAGGLGVGFLTMFIFPSFLPGIVAWLVILLFGLPILLLALALAFLPINNRPFSYFLEAIYNYLTNKKLYLWDQKSEVVYKENTREKQTPVPVTPQNRATTHKSITSLTRNLELQAMQKPGS